MREVSFVKRKKPLRCPFCNDIYWDKPKDERDLFILQEKFLEKNRDPVILGEMYEKFVKYSENIVKKELNRNGLVISRETLEERAQEIAVLLVERYLRLPDSKVENSFGGILIRISKGVLYSTKTKRADAELSLEARIEDGMHVSDNIGFFIEDPLAKLNFEDRYEIDVFEKILKKNDLKVSYEILNLISGIIERIRTSQGYSESFYFLIGLRNYFDKKTSVSMEQYYDFCSVQDRRNIENAKMLIRRYLIERLKE